MNNLIIFDSKGNPIPKHISDNVYRSVINIPKHSVMLPYNMSLYVMEKYKDVNGMSNLTFPVTESDISISIKGEGYNFYSVDEDFVSKGDNIVISKNIESKSYNGDITTDFISSKPYILNLLHIGEEEKEFNGSIGIYQGEQLIWVIDLYTETEDDDERFSELLENINENISNSHEIIFRNSDINEDLPSSMLLNEKRKELLTIINDMSPYLSSVRGMYDLIDYFDYSGVIEIKEYWYNKIDDKVQIVPVTDVYKDKKLEKLNKYGLFYKLNEPTDDYGFDGLPVLKDNFTFSHDEILIKLFALKTYFEDRSIGGISEIADIIGEIYNFQLLSIRHWRTTSDVLVYDNTPNASFEVEEGDNYIDIIPPIIENVVEPYVRIEEIAEMTLDELKHHSFTHFKGYFNSNIRYNDDGNVQIGSIIKIKNTTFKDRIKDINYPWNVESMLDITWLNSSNPNFYKIQYTIFRNSEEVSKDLRAFRETYTGTIDEMSDISLVVPYDGYYDVRMTCIGYDNTVISCFVRKAFLVRKRDINFMFIFKVHDKQLQSFSTNDLKWTDVNQEFTETVNYNNNLHSHDDTATPRYADIEYFNIDGDLMKQRFKKSSYTWNDYSLMSFEDTFYQASQLQRFTFSGIVPSSYIQVDDNLLQIPRINVNEYGYMSEIFKDSFTRKYDYIPRKRLSHSVIDCLSLTYKDDANIFVGSSEDNIFSDNIMTTWKDFEHVFYKCNIQFRASKRVIKTKFIDNSFTVSNVKSFYNEVDAPRVNPLFMSIENNNIYGKAKADWKLYDSDGKMISHNKGTECVHSFSKEGNYTVELMIEDINGNKYHVKKENVIKILTSNEYLNTYRNAVR